MMSRRSRVLSLEELSLHAKREIGEAGSDVDKNLKKLKKILQEEYDTLQLPPNFDDFLLRCIRVRKFDINRAAKLVSQYFKLLREMEDMHSCLIPSQYSRLYSSFAVGKLKYRDSEGRAVILARQELCSPAEYSFDEALAATLLMIDEVNRSSVDTQRLGVVFICDWQGYSFAHFRQTNPSRLRTAAKLFQDAFPARFKAFHFVRNPFLVSCMFAIVRPFLREKLKKRIYFHGHDLEKFHELVSPNILPEFLGGSLPDDDYIDMDISMNLLRQDEYYESMKRKLQFEKKILVLDNNSIPSRTFKMRKGPYPPQIWSCILIWNFIEREAVNSCAACSSN